MVYRGEKHGRWLGGLSNQEKECKHCEHTFRGTSQRIFCSRKCNYEWKIKAGSTKGENNGMWRGGKYYDKDGYVQILMPEHPMAKKDGYVLEHRFIMSEYIGRLLGQAEVVHHIDEVKDNNQIENLELYEKREHDRMHTVARYNNIK